MCKRQMKDKTAAEKVRAHSASERVVILRGHRSEVVTTVVIIVPGSHALVSLADV